MLEQPPQPTSEQIAQRLHQMDIRLDQHYPGYLKQLAHLREPRVVHDRTWKQHECGYGSDNERQQ